MQEERVCLTKAIAIYSRKSRFTGKGESIENQIELCRQYIGRHFPEALTEGVSVYEDEGFSGGNTERPEFKRMMKDAGAGGLKAIVCYRLDRVSRNIGDFARLIETLEARGVAFISIKEQFDTASPLGRAMMYIASVFSQLERETIAERIRDNMRELAKTGRWLGGVTPLGYTSVNVVNASADGKTRKSCALELSPEEGELVRRIYDVYIESGSLTQTEAFLLQRGVRTKRGNPFTRLAIRSILSSPVYMIADGDARAYFAENEAEIFADEKDFDGYRGIMAYNRTLQKPGHAHKTRPMAEWIVSVGSHRGIISGAEWARVQKSLGKKGSKNGGKSYGKPRGQYALLSGLLQCQGCGGFMRPKLVKGGDAPGGPVYSYLCRMKERSKGQRCAVANVRGGFLDGEVCREVSRIEADGGALASRLEAVRRDTLWPGEESGGELAGLRKSLGGVEKEIETLISVLAKGEGSSAGEHILRRIEALDAEAGGLRERIAEQERVQRLEMTGEEAEGLVRALSSFTGVMERMSVQEKREALNALVEKVVWDGENAHVYMTGYDG